MNLGDLLPRAAAAHGAEVALIAGDREITYAELEDRARRAAAALADLGIRSGDRVALLLGNVPEFVEALHGAWRIGAVVAPLNVMLTPEEAGAVLADAEPSAVIADPAFAPVVLAVESRVPTGHVIVTGPRPAPGGASRWEDLLAAAGEPPEAEIDADDLALLQYTAGTTARPKGAMLTHGNLLANLDQMWEVPVLREAGSDVVLLALPLFHIYALNVILGITIREGAAAVLVERFDPRETLELVERHRITILFGAPPMFSAWLHAAGDPAPDLSAVRMAVSGAAPLPGHVLDAFRERFGITIWEGYGLTESAPAVTTNALGDVAKQDSIGRVLPGMEVRLVDDDGEDVADGDPGEIVIRGPNVFQGYRNRPEETAAVFRDGWLRTGDIAYRDEDGYLYIVDRSKDLVIVSGFNVYPKEVEEAIATHPGVAEVAVIGVPDDRTGEAVKALVVPKAGASPSEEDILDHCRETLARFKWPKHIEFVDALPKHVTGKVLRRALREQP